VCTLAGVDVGLGCCCLRVWCLCFLCFVYVFVRMVFGYAVYVRMVCVCVMYVHLPFAHTIRVRRMLIDGRRPTIEPADRAVAGPVPVFHS
jgi:hypothetical protein